MMDSLVKVYTCLIMRTYGIVWLLHGYTDIDECVQESSGCSQGCKNTNGSFICNCHEGYQTHHDDPTSCVGMLYS